jgi:hypothetical protein
MESASQFPPHLYHMSSKRKAKSSKSKATEGNLAQPKAETTRLDGMQAIASKRATLMQAGFKTAQCPTVHA